MMAVIRLRPETLAIMCIVIGVFTLVTMFLLVHESRTLDTRMEPKIVVGRRAAGSWNDGLGQLKDKGDGFLDWDDLDPIRNFPSADVDFGSLSDKSDGDQDTKGNKGNFLCETIMEQPSASTVNTYSIEKGTDAQGGDLFPIKTKDINVLKRVCDALDQCQGFNSNGWLKKSIGTFYKAKADIYVKETPVTQNSAYLSYQTVEENYGKDYIRMTNHMKIYMYDLESDKGIPSPNDYKYGVEQLFIDLLKKSSFRTMNPGEATFFFIPMRCTAYRKKITDRQEAQKYVEKMANTILEEIKSKYPYWDWTLGADHFYICAHDLGGSLTGSTDLNLQKNAIALVNSADYENIYYVPHKDISLPPHPSASLAARGQGGTAFDPSDRTTLAFIAGNMDRGRIRPSLVDVWSSDPDFKIFVGHLADDRYQHHLKTSKFCLCPRGNEAWSPRLMDAVWFGCVPVILSNYYDLPLQGLVEWESFSVIIPESQIKRLKEILQSVSPEKLANMQTRLRHVYAHFTWNDPPRPYDAFNSVLFQLWKRKGVVRYRKDVS